MRRLGVTRTGMVATVLLAALVALAAAERSHLAVTGRHTGLTAVTGATIGLAVGAAFSSVFFLLLARSGRRGVGRGAEPQPWWQSLLSAAMLVALFALAVARLAHRHAIRRAGRGAAAAAGAAHRTAHHVAVAASTQHATEYAVLAGLLLVPAVLAVYALTHRQRWASRTEPAPATGAEREALIGALSAAAEELETADDPRTAIVGCYRGMERALADAGSARLPYETPVELLVRAAAAGLLPVGPAAELVGLFEEARFSMHPLAESHRDRARLALRAVRDHLGHLAGTGS